MFSNMQAILANLVVPVVRLLLFIAAYAAIKFIQTKAAIYKAKKEAKIRDLSLIHISEPTRPY